MNTVLGLIFYVLLGLFIWLIRPSSKIHKKEYNKGNRIKIIIVCIGTILACTLPMSLSPEWNGEYSGYKNQYEILADSIIEGHINFDYEVDEKLLNMENPYDPVARTQLGVTEHWDTAFYNGKYYMYFGVVPVILVFIPYKLLTGMGLTTYHATQLFVALFIIGIFYLFNLLVKKLNKNLSLSAYLFLSVALSVACVWWSIGFPALYCTATSSGLCFQVWSLIFFIKAVYFEEKENKQILYATLGSLFGALIFGCRPPMGFFNILVLPMLIDYLKKRKFNFKLLIPISMYLIVGVALMYYNYIRFDNPFEFGQAYQLTSADQSGYVNMFSRLNLLDYLNSLYFHFIQIPTDSFTLNDSIFGLITCNPSVWFIIYGFIKYRPVTIPKEIRKHLVFGVITILIIVLMLTMYSPHQLTRYRQDFIFIYVTILFVLIQCVLAKTNNNERLNFILTLVCIVSIGFNIFMFLMPRSKNVAEYYGIEEIVKKMVKILSLGIYKG